MLCRPSCETWFGVVAVVFRVGGFGAKWKYGEDGAGRALVTQRVTLLRPLGPRGPESKKGVNSQELKRQ